MYNNSEMDKACDHGGSSEDAFNVDEYQNKVGLMAF
jgi:hypothetical protein